MSQYIYILCKRNTVSNTCMNAQNLNNQPKKENESQNENSIP